MAAKKSTGTSVPITPEGAARLQRELDTLWNVERRRVTREVSEAAAQGDRSENAEYIYGKRRLREIDRRIHYLRRRLDQVVVVRAGEVADRDRIYFGATVTLEDEEGDAHRYRLVGHDEFAVERGEISVESPLARALLGKARDDEVRVARPQGDATYVVLEIAYDAAPPVEDPDA